MPEKSGSKVSILNAVKTPLVLSALVVLTIGSMFGLAFQLSGIDRTLTIAGSMLLLLAIIVFAGLAQLRNPRSSDEIDALWNDDDIPLSEHVADAWKGEWNAEWSYKDESGLQEKYVDDKIVIDSIDNSTGKFTGHGNSSYEKNKTYLLSGRISKKRICHLFYSTTGKRAALSGMAILRMSPMGEIDGWWIGAGRRGGDIGGGVMFSRSYPGDNFEIKTYDMSTQE